MTKAALLLIIAAACALLAWYETRLTDWLRYLLIIAAIILASTGLVELISYATSLYLDRLMMHRQIEAITPAREFVRMLAGLSPVAQYEIAERFGAEISGLARLGSWRGGDAVMLVSVRMSGQEIPLDFIHEFLGKSNHRRLCPIRH